MTAAYTLLGQHQGHTCAACGNWVNPDDGDAKPDTWGHWFCGDCNVKADLDEAAHGRPTLDEEEHVNE